MAIEFCPDIVDNPQPLDVDLFIEFLGFTLDYRYLSHCQCYLGVTVFRKMKFPTFNMSTFRPELTCVDENTIIIDEGLYHQMESLAMKGGTDLQELMNAVMRLCIRIFMPDKQSRSKAQNDPWPLTTVASANQPFRY